MNASSLARDDGNFVDDPWYLTKEGKGKMIKSIKSVRFPTDFGVNFKKEFTKGNEFAGMNTHDWHNFLRVCMCTLIEVIYITYYVFKIILFFHLFYISCVINLLEHSICSTYYLPSFKKKWMTTLGGQSISCINFLGIMYCLYKKKCLFMYNEI